MQIVVAQINSLRKWLIETSFFLGEVLRLFAKTINAAFTRPFYFSNFTEQIVHLGIGSISITVVIGFCMGLVMTLNFGYGLQKFGGTLYVPGIVMLSIVREMGPIFTSLLVAGRIGSGIAAELGSMSVTQQVDALRALGTSPIRILVVPRMLAAMISLPLLTALANACALIGSYLVCKTSFHMSFQFYIDKVLSIVKIHDFTSGLLKTVVFSVLITMIACYKGLNTKDGTRGVGKSTTWVVVTTSIAILISDFILSKILLVVWG